MDFKRIKLFQLCFLPHKLNNSQVGGREFEVPLASRWNENTSGGHVKKEWKDKERGGWWWWWCCLVYMFIMAQGLWWRC